MSKLIYAFFASLDGYIADDAGDFSWAVPDEEVLDFINEVERDPDLVREIKAAARHDLNVSGADVAASAWHAGVIDECHVFVAPMLVGGGKRMFPDNLRQALELLDERRFGNGMVYLRYAVTP